MIRDTVLVFIGSAATGVVAGLGVLLKRRFERRTGSDERERQKVEKREEFRKDISERTMKALTEVFISSPPPLSARFSKSYTEALACIARLPSARAARRCREMVDKCLEAAHLEEPSAYDRALYSIELTRLHELAIQELAAEVRSSVWS